MQLSEEWSLYFLYRSVVLYHVSQDFGRSTRVSAITREKTSGMSHWGGGGHESVVMSAIARIHTYGSSLHSFLYAFRRGLAPVRNGRMFAGQGESRLYWRNISFQYRTKLKCHLSTVTAERSIVHSSTH